MNADIQMFYKWRAFVDRAVRPLMRGLAPHVRDPLPVASLMGSGPMMLSLPQGESSGETIGRSVIVVTRDVLAYAIAGGVPPAKFIRWRFASTDDKAIHDAMLLEGPRAGHYAEALELLAESRPQKKASDERMQ